MKQESPAFMRGECQIYLQNKFVLPRGNPSQKGAMLYNLYNISIIGNVEDTPELAIPFSSTVEAKIGETSVSVTVKGAMLATHIPKDAVNLYDLSTNAAKCG